MSVICARISGVLRSSCILLGGEINHEGHEGQGEFRFVLSLCGTLAIWGARAASPQCSAACRAQNPSASHRRSARVAHASRVLAMTSRHRGLLRKDCFGETPKVRAGLALGQETRALPGNRSERRVRSSVFSPSRRVLLLRMRFLLLASALLCASC